MTDDGKELLTKVCCLQHCGCKITHMAILSLEDDYCLQQQSVSCAWAWYCSIPVCVLSRGLD